MNAHTRTEFADLMDRAGLGIEEAAKLLSVSERSIRRYVDGTGSRVDPLKLEKLCQVANERCKRQPEGAGFRFIDLFAGIGGLRVPFEEIGGRGVFAAEWDRYSRETYKANFPEPADSEHLFAGDIRPFAAEPEKVPSHDVLLAGFPCQPFSIAGVSKKNSLGRPHGFLCDTQGTLFYDLAKIIAHHRPPAFLLENVKNLERHDGGKTFATIMHVLRNELGYNVSHRVISSTPWVPQKRERIFIVGFRNPEIAFDFDRLAVPEGDGPKLGAILDPEVDPLGKGFHIIQSTIAIGSGGVYGKGWLNGTQSHLDFLPEGSTDFIFAAFSEEFGLVGGCVLLVLYFFILARCLYMATRGADTYGRLLSGSLTLIFFLYAFVNSGMVSGLLPVVGLPLPLLSYGGTSLVTIMAGFGMLMSVYSHRRTLTR